MRHIGLFLEELRQGATHAEFFQETLDIVDVAEAGGLDGIWLGEIHFLPARSVLSAPLVLATAIASRTRRMCVGTAVHLLPLRNPLSVAEDVATLDHLSGGRFELGIGRSGSPRAYDVLGIPYDESQGRLMEALEVIREAWKGKAFSFHGHYFHVENATVAPRPLQTPHPPVRIAALNPASFTRAAELGLHIFVGLRGVLLQAFADQAALALSNAWLLEEAGIARTSAEASERRFRDLVEHLDAVVWEVGVSQVDHPEAGNPRPFTFMSRRVEALLGYPVDRWLGEPGFWLAVLHPDDRDRAVAACQGMLAGGTEGSLEYRVCAADGRTVWIQDRVRVMRDAGGRIVARRGLMVDITAQKAREEERARLVAAVEQAAEGDHGDGRGWRHRLCEPGLGGDDGLRGGRGGRPHASLPQVRPPRRGVLRGSLADGPGRARVARGDHQPPQGRRSLHPCREHHAGAR